MKKISELITCEYRYDTEEERKKHVQDMELKGFECTGQIKKSDDSLMIKKREYYWYAKFFKYI